MVHVEATMLNIDFHVEKLPKVLGDAQSAIVPALGGQIAVFVSYVLNRALMQVTQLCTVNLVCQHMLACLFSTF